MFGSRLFAIDQGAVRFGHENRMGILHLCQFGLQLFQSRVSYTTAVTTSPLELYSYAAVSSLDVAINALSLPNEAMGITPAKTAFDSARVRTTPQSHVGYASSSIERPSLAKLVDNICIRNSGPLQPGVFWTKSDKRGIERWR